MRTSNPEFRFRIVQYPDRVELFEDDRLVGVVEIERSASGPEPAPPAHRSGPERSASEPEPAPSGPAVPGRGHAAGAAVRQAALRAAGEVSGFLRGLLRG